LKKLTPSYWYDTIYDIDFDMLKEKGIKCLFFDIDNTMALYSDNEPSEKLLDFLKNLSDNDFSAAVLSNGKSERVTHFAEAMGLVFYGGALKPSKKGFRDLSGKLGYGNDEIAIIGDQLFTDIWGGNRFGCTSVLVTPIDLADDPPFVRFKRIFEKGIIKKLKKTK